MIWWGANLKSASASVQGTGADFGRPSFTLCDMPFQENFWAHLNHNHIITLPFLERKGNQSPSLYIHMHVLKCFLLIRSRIERWHISSTKGHAMHMAWRIVLFSLYMLLKSWILNSTIQFYRMRFRNVNMYKV